MPRSNFADGIGLVDPLLQFNFDLIIPNMPGTSGYDAREFKTKIMTTSIPGRAIEPVEIALHGSTYDTAGRVQYTRTLPFEMLETRDLKSRKALLEWHRFTRDDSSLGAYYKEYATTVDLRINDDKDNVSRIIRLYKCWLESFEDVSLDGGASAAAQVSGSLRYATYIDVTV
jgi:hypothetical protein